MHLGRVILWLTLAFASATSAAASLDEQMQKLALDSGCTLCHAKLAKADGMSVPPRAPAWNAIAGRYRGQDVEDRLVAAVVQGTGADRRHWRGTIATMPPNAVEVSERDARALVRWILRQ
jgi:cytochrome c551/c552